jgi:hypothetical protein
MEKAKRVEHQHKNNYLFDKKKGKLFLAREQKNSGKKFFLFIEHEVLFYETPFLHRARGNYVCSATALARPHLEEVSSRGGQRQRLKRGWKENDAQPVCSGGSEEKEEEIVALALPLAGQRAGEGLWEAKKKKKEPDWFVREEGNNDG